MYYVKHIQILGNIFAVSEIIISALETFLVAVWKNKFRSRDEEEKNTKQEGRRGPESE